ncbi:hypothetical protein WJX73_006776 [Symbiochloris irregularis]|uniref:non-specific serine/threonine protein kinase n=1 Tax=Symbiochloris irregularis TaxID=706552 RepID=A0AAW1PCM3_9CHLO
MEYLLQSFTACLQTLGPFKTYLPSYFAFLPEVEIGGKKYSIVRQLAEGGYSFVYLVRESVGTGEDGKQLEFALKKVLAATPEQYSEAKLEIQLMTQLSHPNILPLLAHSVANPRSAEGSLMHVLYMLFPLYQDGSLWDVVTALALQGRSLDWREALDIFRQTCRAVLALHRMRPAMAHRDIKPHNVLLQRRGHRREQRTTALQNAAEAEALQSRHGPSPTSYQAVLMDFGSARPAHVTVRNRTEALMLQEDAEKLCTAPYRAPELFDVASQCTVDERIDVWSLGCLLYFMLYGCSPFERVLEEAGGSLALAVINGSVSFPAEDRQPKEPRMLVQMCLNTDPQTRPFVEDILQEAERILVA